MPTCPGCEQQIAYERLDAHERYCPGLHSPDKSPTEAVRRLERRLDRVEQRLERRLDVLERTVENETSGRNDGIAGSSKQLHPNR